MLLINFNQFLLSWVASESMHKIDSAQHLFSYFKEMQALLLLLLLLVAPHLAALLLWPSEVDETNVVVGKLSEALQLIIRRTCAAHNASVFISSSYGEQLPAEQQQLVRDVLDLWLPQAATDAAVVPTVVAQHLVVALGRRLQLLLIFVQSLVQLQAADVKVSTVTSKSRHKYLIVLLPGVVSNAQLEMSRIFDYLQQVLYNIDVLLLWVPDLGGGVKAYSFWPYRATGRAGARCAASTPMRVPLRAPELYPVKLHNLQGCPLHVIVWHIPPYVELLPGSAQLEGLDADLLKVLAHKLNFSLALVDNEPPTLLGGSTYMNGSFTGAYKMLRERRANLTLGSAACTPARRKFLASTVPYMQMEYVLVLRKAESYSSYQIMLFPFDGYTWLLLLGLYLLRLLLRLCLGRQAAASLPAPLRLGWHLLVFLLCLSYESSIFEFVHNAPRRPLPLDLEQALREGYSFITDHATHRMTETLPLLNAHTAIVPGQPVDVFEHLLLTPRGSRIGAFSSNAFLAYHLTKHVKQRLEFVRIAKKVLDSMNCIYLPAGSYLAPLLDTLLFDLRSFGITQKLSKRINWRTLPPTTAALSRAARRKAAHADRSNESKRFIHATLNCLLIAESITIAIFALECLSQWHRLRWLARLFQSLI